MKLPQGYKIIIPSSEKELEDYFYLRWEVLRKPWNQPRGSEKDELEDSSHHILIKDNQGNAAGCGRIQFNDTRTSQVRFMAVRPDLHGKGLGKVIMHELEKFSMEANRFHVILQARENAVDFYKALGYELSEKTFLLYSSIQHYLMQKYLKKES